MAQPDTTRTVGLALEEAATAVCIRQACSTFGWSTV